MAGAWLEELDLVVDHFLQELLVTLLVAQGVGKEDQMAELPWVLL